MIQKSITKIGHSHTPHWLATLVAVALSATGCRSDLPIGADSDEPSEALAFQVRTDGAFASLPEGNATRSAEDRSDTTYVVPLELTPIGATSADAAGKRPQYYLHIRVTDWDEASDTPDNNSSPTRATLYNTNTIDNIGIYGITWKGKFPQRDYRAGIVRYSYDSTTAATRKKLIVNEKLTRSNGFKSAYWWRKDIHQDERLRIYAYAPYNAQGIDFDSFDDDYNTSAQHLSNVWNKTRAFFYTNPTDPAQQQDLLLGEIYDLGCKYYPDLLKRVGILDRYYHRTHSLENLTMRHALTALRFELGKGFLAGTVKSISFSNVYTKGKCYYSPRYVYGSHIYYIDGLLCRWDPSSYSMRQDVTIPINKSHAGAAGTQLLDEPYLVIPQDMSNKKMTLRGSDRYGDFELTYNFPSDYKWGGGRLITYTISDTRQLKEEYTLSADKDKLMFPYLWDGNSEEVVRVTANKIVSRKGTKTFTTPLNLDDLAIIPSDPDQIIITKNQVTNSFTVKVKPNIGLTDKIFEGRITIRILPSASNQAKEIVLPVYQGFFNPLYLFAEHNMVDTKGTFDTEGRVLKRFTWREAMAYDTTPARLGNEIYYLPTIEEWAAIIPPNYDGRNGVVHGFKLFLTGDHNEYNQKFNRVFQGRKVRSAGTDLLMSGHLEYRKDEDLAPVDGEENCQVYATYTYTSIDNPEQQLHVIARYKRLGTGPNSALRIYMMRTERAYSISEATSSSVDWNSPCVVSRDFYWGVPDIHDVIPMESYCSTTKCTNPLLSEPARYSLTLLLDGAVEFDIWYERIPASIRLVVRDLSSKYPSRPRHD